MKKLIDLLREAINDKEIDDLIASLDPGQSKKISSDSNKGYRKNANPTVDGNYRTNKQGGSLPDDWKDRKAGVDFEPNQRMLARRSKYDAVSKKMKDAGTTRRPIDQKMMKLGNDKRDWRMDNYVAIFPNSEKTLDQKDDILYNLTQYFQNYIDKMVEFKLHNEMSQEDMDKMFSSFEIKDDGFFYFWGPRDIAVTNHEKGVTRQSPLEIFINKSFESSKKDSNKGGRNTKARVLALKDLPNSGLEKRAANYDGDEDGEE